MNEAPGLPLTIGLMGELVETELGREVTAEGFERPALDPFPQGRNPSNRGPLYLLQVVRGEWGTLTKCGHEVLAS